MERLLDERLAPLTLVVERGAKAAVLMARLGEHNDETETTIASLMTLSETAAQASASQVNLAQTTRENSQYLGALRKPGMRLASIYERFAANFDRIGQLRVAHEADV